MNAYLARNFLLGQLSPILYFRLSTLLLSNGISRSLVSNALAVLPFDRLSRRLLVFGWRFANAPMRFRNVFTYCALSPSASFLALFAASTLYLGRERVPMPCIVRAAKHHAGSWPRPSTVINLKREKKNKKIKEKEGGKASYLFLRAREEDRGCARIIIGDRKRRTRRDGRGCITSLHHVRGKWGWETARRKYRGSWFRRAADNHS